MKKIIFISIITMLLSACGDNSTTANNPKTQTVKNKEKLQACSILSEGYIKTTFPGATIKRMEDSGGMYPLCNVDLMKDGEFYAMYLTLGVIGGANEALLEVSVSHFKKKGYVKPISDVGEKAYNKDGMMGQISAIQDGNLIHFGISKEGKYDLELSKKIISDMFDVLTK